MINITWLDKTLQINDGSYGILCLSAHSNHKHYTTEFNFKTFSFTDCGGKHEHHNFTLTIRKALRVANALMTFKQNTQMSVTQEYTSRGQLHLVCDGKKMSLSIGTFSESSYSGCVYMTKVQARKVAGYIFYWLGEHLVGQIEVTIPRQKKKILDTNDVMREKEYPKDVGLDEVYATRIDCEPRPA